MHFLDCDIYASYYTEGYNISKLCTFVKVGSTLVDDVTYLEILAKVAAFGKISKYATIDKKTCL